MLEKIVGNAWLRWSYALVIIALQLVLLSPYALPSRERLYSALSNEIAVHFEAGLSALPNTTKYADLKSNCLGAKMSRCVNDVLRGRIEYEEGPYFYFLYANELSVRASTHIWHACTGVLMSVRCHTTIVQR